MMAHKACKGRVAKNNKGAALVEYGILVGLIAVLAIAAVMTLGGNIKKTFEEVDQKVASSVASAQASNQPQGSQTTAPLFVLTLYGSMTTVSMDDASNGAYLVVDGERVERFFDTYNPETGALGQVWAPGFPEGSDVCAVRTGTVVFDGVNRAPLIWDQWGNWSSPQAGGQWYAAGSSATGNRPIVHPHGC